VNALILGGGDGLAARDLVALPKVRKVTLVELDPEMIEMASTVPEMTALNRNVFRSPKLRTVIRNARTFLKERHPEIWNLIVADFPDPTPALSNLYSESFYRDVVENLDGLRGIVSIQCSDIGNPGISRMVSRNLSSATFLPSKILTFRGDETHGGYVVRGGMGSL
jgi:spermidine synthase